MILDKINQTGMSKPETEELPLLAEEIRQFIIEVVAKNGGHLSSNLGVVELTIALHRLLDLKKIPSFGMWATKPIPTKF